jgi:hypothetical protein
VAVQFAGVPFAGAVTNHNPTGFLDSVTFANGSVRASGWALDPDTTAPIQVKLMLNGRYFTTTKANQLRKDVGLRYPGWGDYHGWWSAFPIANGSYTLCAIALNQGSGSNTPLGCKSVTVNNDPVGELTRFDMTPGGVRAYGWALDPNTKSAATVEVRLDGNLVKTTTAATSLFPLAPGYSTYYGDAHWYDVTVPVTDGTHTLCVTALNIGLGSGNVGFPCKTIPTTHNPIGNLNYATRATATSTSVNVLGWAFDPDQVAAIKVQFVVDNALLPAATFTANQQDGTTGIRYPEYGSSHKFSGTLTVDAYEHTLCARGVNVSSGVTTVLGCALLKSTGDTTPAPVSDLQAWPGNGLIDLTWSAPRSPNSAITGYTVTMTPDGVTQTVAATATTVRFSSLANGKKYSFTIRAKNGFGTGSASPVASTTPSVIPPQFTPAPVSTSHYPRNWTGNQTNDAAMMRQMGATDASYNPSGHRYLVLQDIGGQDTGRGGALLSATSKFFSYNYVVAMMKAYMDGYHSTQKQYAPMLLAVGTNNDVDVSAAAGGQWANAVIDPLVSYAGRYPGITIAGANDIEPGFSATVAESKAWVSGYLANTSAKYVFNGSADGCSTSSSGMRCNNGWTMADLHWVGGGAAPTRSIALPQIYNSAMPLQWKYISLTGVQAGKPKTYFGGPLTEWTACDQAGSCFSISNVNAWSQLWQAISSISQTKQYDMPFGTDLKIN